ncbi:transcriptional regulator [Pseudescherichia vulneris]
MNKMYYAVNNWLIDLPSGSIISLVSGEKKRLGEYQLKLLDVLVKNAGKILTREELTTLVWERRVIGNNSLPNAIHALRSALEDDGKAQKIIKTIPKKGYLLEQAWCRSVEHESEDIEQPAPLSEPVIDDEVVEEPHNFPALPQTPVQQEAEVILSHEPLAQIRERSRNYQPLFALLALIFVVLASGVAGWHYATSHDSRLIAMEQEAGVYSNIQIYAISEANQLEMNKEDFYSKIKDTLYIVNQQIKSQSLTMTVYYQSVDQTLNYTFALKSRCGSKQLVMAIYHWRIDPALLNNLILRETRRKISEMETCA